MSDEGGPFLLAAFICEKVLIEADGVMSAIRIIDRTNVVPPPGLAPSEMPPVDLNHTLFVNFKAGQARGRSSVKLVLRSPLGLKLTEATTPVLWEGEDRGVNLVIPLRLRVEQEGLYWFEVHLEDKLVTKIPFRVMYQSTTLTQAPQI